MQPITIDEVKAYMAVHGCSLAEAWNQVRKQKLLDAAQNAKTIDDIRNILVKLIERSL